MQEERKANTNAKALLEQVQSAGMKDSLKKIVTTEKNCLFLITLTRMNCLIKDQRLFQRAVTLISFYCLIISLTIRPSGKCPIRNI